MIIKQSKRKKSRQEQKFVANTTYAGSSLAEKISS